MEQVGKRAAQVIDSLVDGLTYSDDNSSKIIDNSSFMAVHVEIIGTVGKAKDLISIAHYYEQNGDLMKDPDMVFLRAAPSRYYPVSFQQDGGVPTYQEAILFGNGNLKSYRPALGKQLVSFTNKWMANIKAQQNL